MKKSIFRRVTAMAVCCAMAVQGALIDAGALYFFGTGTISYDQSNLSADGSWKLKSNSEKGWWILSGMEQLKKDSSDTVRDTGSDYENVNTFRYTGDKGTAELRLTSERSVTDTVGETRSGSGGYSSTAGMYNLRNTKLVNDLLKVGESTLNPGDTVYVDYSLTNSGTSGATLEEAGETSIDIYFTTDDFYKKYIADPENYDYEFRFSTGSAFDNFSSIPLDNNSYFVNDGTTRNGAGPLASVSLDGQSSAGGTASHKMGTGFVDPADGVADPVWLVLETETTYSALLDSTPYLPVHEEEMTSSSFHETYYKAYKFIWVPAPDESSSKPDDSSSKPDDSGEPERAAVIFTPSVNGKNVAIEQGTLVLNDKNSDARYTLTVSYGYDFDFRDIPMGDYTFTTDMEGYLPAEGECSINSSEIKLDIELTVLGDASGDGMITVTDISKAAAHVKGTKALNDVSFKAADVNCDSKVNVTDVSIIAAHVKGIKKIGSVTVSDDELKKEAEKYSTLKEPAFDEFNWCFVFNGGMLRKRPQSSKALTDSISWEGGWKGMFYFSEDSAEDQYELVNILIKADGDDLDATVYNRKYVDGMEENYESDKYKMTGYKKNDGFRLELENGNYMQFDTVYKYFDKEYAIGKMFVDNNYYGYTALVRS